MLFAYCDLQRAVRDGRWKLIRYPQINKTQLFDLQSDPDERNDLSSKPEFADKISQMTSLLSDEMRRYADLTPLSVPNPKPAAWSPPKALKPAKP